MGDSSIMEGILARRTTSEEAIVNTLFDTARSDRLRMTSEIQPDLIFPLACLGIIATRYKSKLLSSFGKELLLVLVSKDRKGRLELVEALLSTRRLASAAREEED